jgi:D-sedoheptulose 7-phosphate isomerase
MCIKKTNSFLITINEHIELISQLEQCIPIIEDVFSKLLQTIMDGGKVVLFGNGGSAADAQHLAAELVIRYKKNRRALPAIALTTDTSILTAHSNDFDFDTVFSRQVEALVKGEDMVIGLSTSGNSKNVINGIEVAKNIGATTIAMTGKSGGLLSNIADICIKVPSTETARIQEAHILIGHWLCASIEMSFLQE